MSQEAKIISAIGIFTVIVFALGIFLTTRNTSTPVSTEKVDSKILIPQGSHQTATQSAKVNVVEFADFQCPACRVAYPTVKQLESDYKQNLNLIYRHFPLPQHQNSKAAAMAAEAAAGQNKFWPMYDKLFENQDEWATSSSANDLFIKYATELGLNIDKFKADLNNPALAAKIEKDQNDGVSLGVNSTPTFFINGQKLIGPPSYQELKDKIDNSLK